MSPETLESLVALLVTMAVAGMAVRALVGSYRRQQAYERGRMMETTPVHGHAHAPVAPTAFPPFPRRSPSVGTETEKAAA